jgi:hypothetical protein
MSDTQGARMKRKIAPYRFGSGFYRRGMVPWNAQARVAGLEIAIDAPRGDVKVTCSKGCAWGEQGSSTQTSSFSCDAERCRAAFNGHGRNTFGDSFARVPRAVMITRLGWRYERGQDGMTTGDLILDSIDYRTLRARSVTKNARRVFPRWRATVPRTPAHPPAYPTPPVSS